MYVPGYPKISNFGYLVPDTHVTETHSLNHISTWPIAKKRRLLSTKTAEKLSLLVGLPHTL